MIVPPGRSTPARSAASIIGRPIRSFTDPPGLSISSFARSNGCRSAGPRSLVSREMRTSGVCPTRSRIEDAYSIPGGYRRAGGGARRSRSRPPSLCRFLRSSAPRSGLRAVQPPLAQQEPCQPLPAATPVLWRIDGLGVERLDGGPEDPLEPFRDQARQLQLLAGAGLRRLGRPRVAGELSGAGRRQAPRPHPPADVQLPGPRD